jgi:hypothetical protein
MSRGCKFLERVRSVMSENRGADAGGVVSHEIAVRCVADDCDFELQAGVFDASTVDAFLPSVRDWDTCPACGDHVEEWTPEFAGAAAGRPTDW